MSYNPSKPKINFKTECEIKKSISSIKTITKNLKEKRFTSDEYENRMMDFKSHIETIEDALNSIYDSLEETEDNFPSKFTELESEVS